MNKILAILIFLTIISCNQQKGKQEIHKNGVYKIDEYDVEIGQSLSQKKWECVTLTKAQTCFPRIWKTIDQDSYYFFTYIDTLDKDEFYVIGKFDTDSLGISEKNYLQETYQSLISNTEETLLSYDVKKLVFSNSHAYYAEYTVGKDKKPIYAFYSMTFSDKNVIYDLTLKVDYGEKAKYKQVFQNILYNFQIEGKYFFSKQKEIKEFREVNFSSS